MQRGTPRTGAQGSARADLRRPESPTQGPWRLILMPLMGAPEIRNWKCSPSVPLSLRPSVPSSLRPFVPRLSPLSPCSSPLHMSKSTAYLRGKP